MKNFFLFLFWAVIFFSPHFTSASTTIEARIFRNEAGSGNFLVSSGFPLPEGLVSEQLIREGKIRVIANGFEVAANVSALRGRHNDGTLRSVLIQFRYELPQGGEVSAQVIIDDGIRTLSDPEYIRPTIEIVTNNNVIVPTNTAYTTSTRIAFRNLLPSGAGSASEESFYTWAANDRFDWLMAQNSNYIPVSSYDQVEALVGLWARTGDMKYYNAAVSHTLQLLPYNTPSLDGNPTCNTACSIANPDGRTSTNVYGLPSEPQYPRYYGYAIMYLLTGYRDFWGIVAHMAQYQQNAMDSQAAALSRIGKYHIYDTPRYKSWNYYGALIPAYMVDATIAVNGNYYTGRNYNWSNQFTWTIDALETLKWDFKWIPYSGGSGTVYTGGDTMETTGTVAQGGVTATLLGVYLDMHDEQTFAGNTMPATGYLMVNNISGGTFTTGALTISGGLSATASGDQITDYREGLVAGCRQNSPRGNYSPWDGSHSIPTFQLVFVTNFLIDYYLYIYADPRIPDMVKKNADVILQQISDKAPGQPYYTWSGGIWGDHSYVKSYKLENPVNIDLFESYPNPFELPEYTRIIAFVLKTNGDATINGATYTQWYERCVDTANVSPFLMNWAWKYFGQYYSWGQDAPWLMSQPSVSGPAILRTPIQYHTIPGSTPDIYRESNGVQGDSPVQNISTPTTTSTSTSSKSSSSNKKKIPNRYISNSRSTIKYGQVLMQRGKKFSKQSLILLYFSKPNGTYYAPQRIITNKKGDFSIKFLVKKPKGTYKWYAVDTKTGKKSRVRSYRVR